MLYEVVDLAGAAGSGRRILHLDLYKGGQAGAAPVYHHRYGHVERRDSGFWFVPEDGSAAHQVEDPQYYEYAAECPS